MDLADKMNIPLGNAVAVGKVSPTTLPTLPTTLPTLPTTLPTTVPTTEDEQSPVSALAEARGRACNS
jgi:hypothetical protein